MNEYNDQDQRTEEQHPAAQEPGTWQPDGWQKSGEPADQNSYNGQGYAGPDPGQANSWQQGPYGQASGQQDLSGQSNGWQQGPYGQADGQTPPSYVPQSSERRPDPQYWNNQNPNSQQPGGPQEDPNRPNNGWQQNSQQQGNGWQQNSYPQGNGWQQNSQQQGNNWQQNPYSQGNGWQQDNGWYPQGNGWQQRPPRQVNGLAFASMIVSMLALITCCCSPLVQFPLAVTAIVLVILSKKGQPLSGYAIAGLVMSVFAIILSIAMTLLIGYVRSPEFQNALSRPEVQQFYDEYNDIYESIYESLYDSQMR